MTNLSERIRYGGFARCLFTAVPGDEEPRYGWFGPVE